MDPKISNDLSAGMLRGCSEASDPEWLPVQALGVRSCSPSCSAADLEVVTGNLNG